MLTKLKLWFPLLMILAMVTLALPARSATATMVSPAVQRISPCFVTKLVDIEGDFATVFSVTPYSPTASLVKIFGFGNLFIDHHRRGGLVFGDQIVNFGVVPNTIDGNFSFLTTDGSLIFAEVTGMATPPDANGKTTFSAGLLFFGGTHTYLGAKGDGDAIGSANVLTSKGNFTFEGHIRINVPVPCG